MALVLLRRIATRTVTEDAVCYVCGRGLEDGLGLTARAVRGGNLWFCEKHHR